MPLDNDPDYQNALAEIEASVPCPTHPPELGEIHPLLEGCHTATDSDHSS
jgi:hypothetical protein